MKFCDTAPREVRHCRVRHHDDDSEMLLLSWDDDGASSFDSSTESNPYLTLSRGTKNVARSTTVRGRLHLLRHGLCKAMMNRKQQQQRRSMFWWHRSSCSSSRGSAEMSFVRVHDDDSSNDFSIHDSSTSSPGSEAIFDRAGSPTKDTDLVWNFSTDTLDELPTEDDVDDDEKYHHRERNKQWLVEGGGSEVEPMALVDTNDQLRFEPRSKIDSFSIHCLRRGANGRLRFRLSSNAIQQTPLYLTHTEIVDSVQALTDSYAAASFHVHVMGAPTSYFDLDSSVIFDFLSTALILRNSNGRLQFRLLRNSRFPCKMLPLTEDEQRFKLQAEQIQTLVFHEMEKITGRVHTLHGSLDEYCHGRVEYVRHDIARFVVRKVWGMAGVPADGIVVRMPSSDRYGRIRYAQFLKLVTTANLQQPGVLGGSGSSSSSDSGSFINTNNGDSAASFEDDEFNDASSTLPAKVE